MVKELYQALKGGLLWNRIGDKKVAFFIVPECPKEYLAYALLYADRLLEEMEMSEVRLVVKKKLPTSALDISIKNQKKQIVLKENEMNNLLRFFSLKCNVMGESIFQNVKFISLDYPNHIGARVLADNNIFSIKYLVWHRILHKHHVYAKAVEEIEDINNDLIILERLNYIMDV